MKKECKNNKQKLWIYTKYCACTSTVCISIEKYQNVGDRLVDWWAKYHRVSENAKASHASRWKASDETWTLRSHRWVKLSYWSSHRVLWSNEKEARLMVEHVMLPPSHTRTQYEWDNYSSKWPEEPLCASRFGHSNLFLVYTDNCKQVEDMRCVIVLNSMNNISWTK